ncbi:hypothetical protein HN51_048874 [Arachis hypogaea]
MEESRKLEGRGRGMHWRWWIDRKGAARLDRKRRRLDGWKGRKREDGCGGSWSRGHYCDGTWVWIFLVGLNGFAICCPVLSKLRVGSRDLGVG